MTLPPKKRGVESVETAGHVLRALLQTGGTARLRDLEKLTGIPSAKVHRYLVSLISCGLVRKQKDNHYAFGLLAYQIGHLARHGNDLLTVIEADLEAFVDEIGETCGISVWLDQGATLLRWFQPKRDITISMRADPRLSLIHSTTGRLFGAYLPADLVMPLLEQELASLPADQRPDLEEIAATYAAIRRHGYAAAQGLRTAGLSTFSVPVLDHDGDIMCVLTIIGQTGQFSTSPDAPAPQALLAFAQRLARVLETR